MKLFLTFFALVAVSAQAGVITKIFKVEAPENKSENYQVLALHDGRVFEVESQDLELLKKLKEAANSKSLVDLRLEEESFPIKNESGLERIVDVEILPQTSVEKPVFFPEGESFEPTNLQSLEKAEKMFSLLLSATKWWDQCFNRAHIWNRQMHKDHGVKSEKIFIFYTKKYRREINGKWWFHTAPMVTVQGAKMVLDREFTNKPLTTSDWESIFNVPMERQGYRCKVIERISEYYNEDNDQNEYCNIQYSSMYYWEPSELEDLEEEGLEKSQWVDWEIRAAAKDVFWGWRSVYNRYRP